MEFRLLGPLEASEGEREIALGGPRQRHVLAHLLLRANEVVSTDRLIEDVWDGEPPEAARNALQSYVSRLRGVLRVQIEGRPPGYVLRIDPEQIDAARFERLAAEGRRLLAEDAEAALGVLEEALALWRGPPLADLVDEPSLRSDIGRLEELRLGAVEDRLEAELALGRYSDPAAELEPLVDRYPLRERLWGHLMLALYRSGRQADALAAYQRARRMLAEELGLDPSPELRELQGRILRHDPSLEPEARRLRGYRLLDQIGAGSFGVVHRAVQPYVGREVAVKVVAPALANDPRFVRRFEAEAQLVARLEHPRVVPLYDYWREPNGAYLVMRLLRGGNLKRELEQAPLERDRAVAVVGQVATALAVAHRQGIVHRDVKPANILLDEDGDAYLSDFGIATDVAAELVSPTPDTIAYLSPEQTRGEPTTPQTDVYSLGVVLREALSGQDISGPLGEVIRRATAERPADRFADAEAMADALASVEPARTPVRISLPERNPYKGLRPFEEADAADFFGREALLDRLIGRLRQGDRFLAVVGASGSGKSSAVRAGLFPALRAGALSSSAEWLLAEASPGSLTDLEEALRSSRTGLLLFVDQLEEVFTLVDDSHRRDRFLGLLADVALDPERDVRVVVTLRADFYDRPLAHRALASLLRTGVETLVPPSPEELERAIVNPARRVGVESEPGLVGALIADVSGRAGALPLLQYALTELFEGRHDGWMTLAAYRELGGLGGAVARRADELYEHGGDRGRRAARQLFLRLVTLGEAAAETRRRVSRAELASLEVDQAALEQVIDAFGSHRLLSFDRDPQTRMPTVEVAHEALLVAWGRLRAWIAEARGDVQTRARLAASAAEWEGAGRDPSFLLAGTRLELFDAWEQSSSLALARSEREYLDASRERREAARAEGEARDAREVALERRSRRRLRALALVLAVAALAASGLSLLALDQRQDARAEASRAEEQARIAAARELASAALANLDDDPERSILLAIEAVQTTRSQNGPVLREAEEALHAAVQASRIVLAVPASSGTDRGYPVRFSPDGKRLATADGRSAVVRDAATGEELLRLTGHAGLVTSVVFSPDGSRLVTAGEDRTARVWDAATGREVSRFSGHPSPVVGLGFSADGRRLATTSFAGGTSAAHVWDVTSGRRIAEFRDTGVTGLAVSPDGERLVTADGPLRAWELPSGRALPTPDIDGFGAAFDASGSLLAVAGDGVTTVWEVATGARRLSLAGHRGIVTSVDFSLDGTRLATGGHDGTVRVWELETGRELLVLPGAGGAVDAIAFSPDGSRLAACCGDRRAVVWDITPEGSREVLTLAGHERSVFNVAFSPDGRQLATASEDGTAKVWDVAGGAELLVLEEHAAPVADVVFSPDGMRLATVGFDGTARLADAVTGEELLLLRGHTAPVWGASFSPDGRRLATTGIDMTARVWDTVTGKALLVRRVHDDFVWDIGYSPDGSRLVTVSNDGVPRVWDAASGRMVAKLDGHDGNIVELGFSPDGGLVATAGFDGTARVWSVRTGKAVRELIGHAGGVLDVDFSPDGSRLATASLDGTAKLWDSRTGRQLLSLRVADAGAGRLAFSPDGSLLAIGDVVGTVRIYHLRTEQLVRLARERVTRRLTADECRQYLHRDRCRD